MANGLHVLIIEDEMLIGMDVFHCLAGCGFETFAFAGTEVQALEQARPDVVVVEKPFIPQDFEAACRRLALH